MSRSPTRRATTARTWPEASASWRGSARPAFGASSSVQARPSTVCPSRPDHGGRAAPSDQHVRRDETHLRGRARLLRLGLRVPEHFAALLQCGRRERHERRGHQPETHLIPNVLSAAEQGTAGDRLRRPTIRRRDGTRDPRLHPCRGSRTRPTCSRSRRPTCRTRVPARPCRWRGTRDQSRHGPWLQRSRRHRRRASGGRRPADRDGGRPPPRGRSAGARRGAPIAPQRSSAGTPSTRPSRT